jgi:hypothetical protein
MDKHEKNPRSQAQEHRADAKKANQPARNPTSQFEHGQQHSSSSTAIHQPAKQQASQAQTAQNKNAQQKKK